MAEYYVDSRIMELVHASDVDPNVPPETYYEYRCGVPGIIVECWECEDGRLIDFTTTINNHYKRRDRDMHFKKFGVNPQIMRFYAVPPDWYEEETSKVNKNRGA